MSDRSKTLVCRPVHGFSLYATWLDTVPSRIVRYEVVLPSGGLLPFGRNFLGQALKTFHAWTGVWFWFATDYQLYPVLKDNSSNEAMRYAIAGPNGQIFEFGGITDGLDEAISEFKRLTGVDIIAHDARAEADMPAFAS